ncbi:MAG: hypothetical protein K2P94_13540 [Rhodospirillaceae bacterium]|nr:hypothetical protein [Rhodospirillaceae bacterium]
MIRPRPEELLARIAAALDETVLPNVTHGPSRRQLQAATSVLRRLAHAIPREAAVIAEDAADLEQTLRCVLGDKFVAPDATDLPARHIALQAIAADVPQSNTLLDDYYARSVARELSLNPDKNKSDG